jgi:hypothetical protein
MASVAIARVLKKRAAHSHLSSRTLSVFKSIYRFAHFLNNKHSYHLNQAIKLLTHRHSTQKPGRAGENGSNYPHSGVQAGKHHADPVLFSVFSTFIAVMIIF